MNISDKKTYSNYVFNAVVVNANTDMDPENKGRVQIYIPTMQIEYAEYYAEYAKADKTGKENSPHKDKFPWATTLVADLKDGNQIIGCNLNNNNGEYVVMGLDVNNEVDTNVSGAGGNDLSTYSGNASGILNLAMPILIQNEIGVSVNAWPDNIPDSKYKSINPYDKGCSCLVKSRCSHSGGWSIGLIQWHHSRAFNLMYDIVKNDSSWKSKSPNQNLDIVKDLESCVKKGSTYGYANKYTDNYHPISGTAPYTFIQNVLGSDIGKKVQRDKAQEDIEYSIKLVTSNPYNISNPAIIIWLVDILNQYGNGKTTTIKKAAEISAKGGDMIKALEEFRTWCKSNLGDYYKYEGRRNRTFEYVKQLYNNGKLSMFGGINLSSDPDANKGGMFLWPTPGCQVITSKYGWRGAIAGTSHTGSNFHTGIDLARNGGALGQKIIAAHSGKVIFAGNGRGYGNLIKIENGKYQTWYAHQRNFEKGIKAGVEVQAGQVIGYVDSTGNSSGSHLHFEVRINGQTTDPLPYIKKS